MKITVAIRTLTIIVLFIFFPANAAIGPQLGGSLIDESSLRDHGGIIKPQDGISYNLQASNTDVQTRGLFHNGVSYISVSNPHSVQKMVVVNPQVRDWNIDSVQVSGNLEVEKVWNLLQIKVPAFQSGLIIVRPSGLQDAPSTEYNHQAKTLAVAREEVRPTTSRGELYSSSWESSPIKVDGYGQLIVDGLTGADYDLQPSDMDVLTRGLLYNGVAYILVANPYDMPKEVYVNPRIDNWYIQNVHVEYGTLVVSKFGNQLHITVPGRKSALIIIPQQKRRYSFTAGLKPAYSFSAGPKPHYSFQAGPKRPYSFRIGY
ncbi:MAG: hypothetical protein QUS07_09275 [Methanothrix sp.]|nr:hypothetical protein [Methanothrix sp.]